MNVLSYGKANIMCQSANSFVANLKSKYVIQCLRIKIFLLDLLIDLFESIWLMVDG